MRKFDGRCAGMARAAPKTNTKKQKEFKPSSKTTIFIPFYFLEGAALGGELNLEAQHGEPRRMAQMIRAVFTPLPVCRFSELQLLISLGLSNPLR
jgi:hypothetical protein